MTSKQAVLKVVLKNIGGNANYWLNAEQHILKLGFQNFFSEHKNDNKNNHKK